MEQELGTPLSVPVPSFLAGVLANLGRAPLAEESRARCMRDGRHRVMLDAALR